MTEICEKCEVEYPDKFGNIIHCNTIEPKLSGTYEFEWKDSDTMYSRVEGNTVHLTSKNPTQQDYQALFDALVPLMKVADVLSDKLPDSLGLWSQTSSEEGGDIRLTIGDVRKIRAALQQCAKGCGDLVSDDKLFTEIGPDWPNESGSVTSLTRDASPSNPTGAQGVQEWHVPEGWNLTSIKPKEGMMIVGIKKRKCQDELDAGITIYELMIAAAPPNNHNREGA